MNIEHINIEGIGQYDISVPDGKLTTSKYADKSVTKEKLADNITGQLFSPTPLIGKKLTTSKTEVDDPTYCTSDYIPCQQGDVVEWDPGEADNTAALHTYNASKIISDYYANSPSPRIATLSASYARNYLRFCFKKSHVGAYIKINGILIYQWDGNETGEKVTHLASKIDSLDGQINGTEDMPTLYRNLVPERDNMAYLSDFSCFFFSDIHGSEENFKRIIRLANAWKLKVNAILNGGDVTQSSGVTSVGWLGTDISTLSEVDVLSVVGNHDVTGSSRANVYNYIIKPTVDNVSGIVQPSGAASNYLMYYYKDYGNVRVIMLDADNVGSFWDATEKAWLESVLSDARTQNKHVVIVNHASAENATRIPCTFQSHYDLESWHVVEDAVLAVQDFIDSGGKFCGWLCGHTHWDNFVYPTGFEKQAMFVTMSARYNYGPSAFDVYRSSNPNERNYDAFQMVSIDTQRTLLKIMRIGVNSDIEMKLKNILVYNYSTLQVISNY